jgi:hypothetical protein
MAEYLTYALAKSTLVLPIILLWSMVMFSFECVAEYMSVWNDDSIIGMHKFVLCCFFVGITYSRKMLSVFQGFSYTQPISYTSEALCMYTPIEFQHDDIPKSPTGKNEHGGIHLHI